MAPINYLYLEENDMDINGITQALTAGYDNTKPAKEAEKKNAVTETLVAETAAAEPASSEETAESATDSANE